MGAIEVDLIDSGYKSREVGGVHLLRALWIHPSCSLKLDFSSIIIIIIMRFAALFTAATLALSSVSAKPTARAASVASTDLFGLLGVDLSPANSYGAPIPPWLPNYHPGWYYGDNPSDYPELACLYGVRLLFFFSPSLCADY